MSFIRRDISIKEKMKFKKLKIQRMLFYQRNVVLTNYCSQNLDTYLEHLLIYSDL